MKNPQYPETLYVYGLVGPDTVNTMPLPTLMAARQQGEVTGATAAEDPTADLEALREAGIDLDDVTAKLLRDGIDAFLVPMAKLLDGIERKREAIVTRRPAAIEADLPLELEQPLAERVKRAHDEDVARRIWERDGTLWAPEGTPEVTDRLGWLTIADKMLEEADALDAFVAECKADGLTDVGAARHGRLEPRARGLPPLLRARRRAGCACTSSTRPSRCRSRPSSARSTSRRRCSSSPPSRAGRSRRSRCSSTSTGCRATARTSCSITDPGSCLLELAEENGFRRAFQNDPEIGGRYSALSYFGIVPAALAGIDVRPLLEGAQVAAQACSDFDNPENNAGLWLGLALGELARAGRDKLTFVVDDPIASFGVWVEQLVAESTGKKSRGILPVADEPILPADAYGNDRVFLHLRNTDAPDAGHDEAIEALAKAGHPTVIVQARGPDDLGRVFFLSEFATAVVGWVLEINPFDQPNVQQAKDATKKVLDRGRAGRGRGRPRHAVRRPRAAGLPRDHGLPPVLGGDRGRDHAAAREGDRRAPRRHHLRLRPALPALDRPVPQGRPGRSGASSSSCTTRTRTPTSPATSSTSGR